MPGRRDPFKALVRRGKLLHPYRRRQFAHFGPDSIVHKPMWVRHAHKIEIGHSTLILHGIWLAVEQSAIGRDGPAITIGDNCGIRPHVTITCAERIVIEDGVVLSAFCTVTDSDHTFDNGVPNIIHNPLVTSPIHIGAGTWIAERVAVLRGSRIGRCCIIGANSVVRGEIPDYSIAVGSPARVVGSTRASFSEDAR